MRDLLLFGIVAGLVPLILMRPWIGILAWFWVGLMAPHGLTWGFMRSFPIAVVIGGVTLIALFFARDRRSLPISREMVMMGVFAAFITLTTFFAVNSSGAWEQWDRVMRVLLITFITPMLIYGERRILWLLLVITFSIAFYGFKGGIFAISTGGNYMVLGPSGSFLSGNTYIGLAMIMVLPMVLVVARMFYYRWVDLGIPLIQRFSFPISLGVYAVFWLTAIAILATHSRGAFLGLLAIAPFLFWKMKQKWLLVAMAFILIGVVGVTAPERLVERWQTIENYEEDTSAMQRIHAWGANWNMALERPLVGMGFRNTGMGYDWWIQYTNFGGWGHVLSPHSTYFQVLGQHGFLGLGVYLTLLLVTLLSLNQVRRRALRQQGQEWLSDFAWAIQVGLIGFMAAGAFLDVAYFNLLYALIALTIIMRRELEERVTSTDNAPNVSQAKPAGPSSRLDGRAPRFPDFVARPDDAQSSASASGR